MCSAFGDETVADMWAFDRLHGYLLSGLQADPAAVPYSITQVWALLELGLRNVSDLRELRRRLDIDAGYLSRILLRFETDGLVVRQRSAADPRCRTVRLTPHGHAVSAALDAHLARIFRRHLDTLTADGRQRVLEAMATIRKVVDASPGLGRAPR